METPILTFLSGMLAQAGFYLKYCICKNIRTVLKMSSDCNLFTCHQGGNGQTLFEVLFLVSI